MSQTTTTSAQAFSHSIGVNTHLDQIWTTYAATSTVIDALNYLGVTNVRDSMASPGDATLFSKVSKATGVSFDVYLSKSEFTYDAQIAEMKSASSILRFVEGINEGDSSLSSMSYAGKVGFAAIAAVQTALYQAFNNDPAVNGIAVIGPSYGSTANMPLAINTSAVSNYGNTHEYFGTGNPPGSGIASFLSQAVLVSGTNPVIATEAGYYTGGSLAGSIAAYQKSGVSEIVQAKYLLTLAFDDWKAGVGSTYFYELFDQSDDAGNTNSEQHFGMFHADGTPKIAAIAIRNLMADLADHGTARTDPFGYQVTTASSTGNSLLLEKSTGVFELAVWNDIRLSDAVTAQDVTAATIPATVSFGQTVQFVYEIDPLVGTTPIRTWTGVSSITIDMPDHPVLFEITPYAKGFFSLQSFVVSETVASGGSLSLWGELVGNAIGSGAALATISAIGTSGTHGTVQFNSVTHTLIYTAPTYSPLTPTDSFTYTLVDTTGETITGSVAITQTPPPNFLYVTSADTRTDAPATGWTLVSLAAGQSFYTAFSGVTFQGSADTAMYGGTSGNTFLAGNGNHTIGAGANAHITLGDGDNTVGLTGADNVVTTGNGNNLFWKSIGRTSITTGNGNQAITMAGSDNVISVGIGNSTINVGVDGSPVSNERVTVAGGTNSITVGGIGASITAQNGANRVITFGASGIITLMAGAAFVTAQGATTTVTAQSGNHTIEASGASDIFILGSGNSTLWAGGSNNRITTGTGTANITFAGDGDIIDLTRGANTVTAQGKAATLILAAPGTTATPNPVRISGNVIAAGDTFDLRTALTATSWNGVSSTLSNYLQVSTAGSASTISIDADGTGPGQAIAIAILNDVGDLTFTTLLAHATLSSLTAPTILTITGNMDGGVTLKGTAVAGTTVMIDDSSAGVTKSQGSVMADGNGRFSLVTHTMISTKSVNAFSALSIASTGQSASSTSLFLLSSASSDTLSGTTGQSDVFATFLRTGQDMITNFETTRAFGASHDVLNLSGTGYGSFSQLSPNISGSTSAVIQLDTVRSITLLGVSASLLQASDFRFS